MTVIEDPRREATALIARRLTERDQAPPEERPDIEPFAAALLTELIGFGWRPTEARPRGWQESGREPPASPAQIHAYADHIRSKLIRRGDA